ncbi:transposase [Aspergillus affinis]|uniref:transposase n=1 Tax=Aspergillus affinis TaxID=1070780 RepID=UPI0022FE395E|nr:transposase [Aspergillus affinis]KAI9037480.1 transposase [Aspergillus affinis]
MLPSKASTLALSLNSGKHWLKEHFIPYTKNRRTGQYSLLVLDGHDSHLIPQFDDICRQYDIIPICMPANSSHLCQPLDIVCFSPLKSAYSNLIERLVRTGYYHIDKVNFLDIYPEAHIQAFKKANIQSAFKASGIVPFDPTKVLDNLIFYREESRPNSQRTTSTITKMLLNLKQFKKHESTIFQLLQQADSPASPMQTALSYIFKGAEIALNRAALLEHENLQLRETVERRKRKQQRNQHQMHGLDGFTIQEAREAFANAQAAEEAAGDTGPLDS